eukprot:3165658-Pyramimonas_sp.AAC.1
MVVPMDSGCPDGCRDGCPDGRPDGCPDKQMDTDRRIYSWIDRSEVGEYKRQVAPMVVPIGRSIDRPWLMGRLEIDLIDVRKGFAPCRRPPLLGEWAMQERSHEALAPP